MAPPTVTKRVPGVTGRNHPLPSASGRQATAKDVGESHAGLAGQDARFPVEGDEAVEAAAVEQSAARD